MLAMYRQDAISALEAARISELGRVQQSQLPQEVSRNLQEQIKKQFLQKRVEILRSTEPSNYGNLQEYVE
eukprot:1438919-Rhodomonas_salina.1